MRLPFIQPLAAVAALVSVHFAQAQLPTSVDISMEHDQQANQLKISLRANDAPFGEVLSNLVFTVRWPASSPATLGAGSSAWCPPPSSAFLCSPTATITPGNGFKYRTWNSIGLALLSDLVDDGGCEQTLPADDWVQVLLINITNDPGSTAFDIADDQYANENNRGYYLSLNGQARTGSIYSFSTGTAPATVEGEAEAWAIHPNPASDRVLIALPGHVQAPWKATVLDASGRIALQASGMALGGPLDVSGLACGRYLLQLSASDWTGRTPLIVAR